MKKPSLLIMVPNTGMVHTEFMKTIICLTQSLKTKNVAFAMKTVEFSDIVMSRNYLMSYFYPMKSLAMAYLLTATCPSYPSSFTGYLIFMKSLSRQSTLTGDLRMGI